MDDLVVGELVIPAMELEERFDTAGGPGGQHANRTETAVTLRFDVVESSLSDETKTRLLARIGPIIEVTAGETRSQLRNREMARQRLAERIEAALVDSKPRKATKPTKASRQRRLSDKKSRSDVKKRRRRPTLDD